MEGNFYRLYKSLLIHIQVSLHLKIKFSIYKKKKDIIVTKYSAMEGKFYRLYKSFTHPHTSIFTSKNKIFYF